MKIKGLSIDGFAERLGIDRPLSVSWKLEGTGANAFQKTYRIVLSEQGETRYDSGEVESGLHRGIAVPYAELKSFTAYAVRVFARDLAGELCESDEVEFITGAVKPEDFHGAWIGTGEAKPFYARKELSVSKKIARATAAVCGLGQFFFSINGEKVSDHELDPGWTNYDKKAQYVLFDMTDALRIGDNALGVEVGNGFYLADKGDRYFFEMPPASMKTFMPPNTNGYQPFGSALPLKVMLLIRYEDGSQEEILSDESWKVRSSACKLANVYGSEIFDAREYPAGWNTCGYADEGWSQARLVESPKGEICAQGQPPIRIKQTRQAVLLEKQEDGYLYDLGQNMSCMLELSVRGNAGDKVELLVAEKLDADGKIDQMAKNWNLIDVSCTYILSGDPDGESWKQQFSYVGARYVLVKGAAPAGEEGSLPSLLSLKGHYIVSDSPVTGSFSCDDERFEQVYGLIAEAMDSNLKSVHTDCPSIEKTAWLEESHLLAPSIMFFRDVRDLWEKIFDDAVRDQYTAETAENGIMGEPVYRGAGFLPPIAPSYGKLIVDTPMGNFWDLIAWSSFPILGADWFYRYYGDRGMIEKYYDADCRYMEYLAGKLNEDGFIAHGLGDWGNPQFGAQARANVETAFYYADLTTMAGFAALLGKSADQETFKARAEAVRSNYNAKLLTLNEQGKWCYRAWDHPEMIFCTQACQALPLHFGMVPEDKKQDVEETLLALLAPTGFVSGEVGFPAILRSLQACGKSELIWELAMKEDAFSFYHFVQTGETALGEYWEDNPRSHNHDMMGSLMECYYTDIAGIKCRAPGFAEVLIQPRLPMGMKRMNCKYNSVQGQLEVNVDLEAETKVEVTIPAGMKVEIDLGLLGLPVKENVVPGQYSY